MHQDKSTHYHFYLLLRQRLGQGVSWADSLENNFNNS